MDYVELLANEYSEESWNAYSNCFVESDILVEGVPQDIVNAVVTILGDEVGCKWLHTPLHKLKGQNALVLLKTSKGERALKAFIMRLPN